MLWCLVLAHYSQSVIHQFMIWTSGYWFLFWCINNLRHVHHNYICRLKSNTHCDAYNIKFVREIAWPYAVFVVVNTNSRIVKTIVLLCLSVICLVKEKNDGAGCCAGLTEQEPLYAIKTAEGGTFNMKQRRIYHLPPSYKYMSPEHSICKAERRYFVKASTEISADWTWREHASQEGADTMWNSSQCIGNSAAAIAIHIFL